MSCPAYIAIDIYTQHWSGRRRGDTWWRSWLMHWATSRKVAGSIPDVVTGILLRHNPSGRTLALGLTQPLTQKKNQEYFLGVKAAGAYGWQPYHLHVPNVLRSVSLDLLEPSGPVQACNGIALLLLVWKDNGKWLTVRTRRRLRNSAENNLIF